MCDKFEAMHVDPTSPDYKNLREFQSKLRDRLKGLRKANDYTQLDMAECGISTRHYERLEQNPTAIISLWQLFRLASFYNMPIDDLLNIK